MGCSPQKSSAFGRTELPMIILWSEHDSIYEENEQKAVILSIEVKLYEEGEPFIHDLLHNSDIRHEPDWTVLKA